MLRNCGAGRPVIGERQGFGLDLCPVGNAARFPTLIWLALASLYRRTQIFLLQDKSPFLVFVERLDILQVPALSSKHLILHSSCPVKIKDDHTVPTQAAAPDCLPQVSGFKSSMTLYGLVKTEGSSDVLNQDRVQIMCAPCGNAKAIQAFVSRLDAELMAKTHAKQGYRVISLSGFDPNQFIHDHQGWLMMHICCGFTARERQLLSNNGHLMPLGWFTYAETGSWTASHYIDWGLEMSRLLQTSYAAIGLPNYNTWLNELDCAPAAQMHGYIDEAWRALPSRAAPEDANQHALFDPMTRCWRFAATQLEIRQPQPTI